MGGKVLSLKRAWHKRIHFIYMAENGQRLPNGYPFRDDFFNFFIAYKNEKHYFEFPVSSDRTILLEEIKKRLGKPWELAIRRVGGSALAYRKNKVASLDIMYPAEQAIFVQ